MKKIKMRKKTIGLLIAVSVLGLTGCTFGHDVDETPVYESEEEMIDVEDGKTDEETYETEFSEVESEYSEAETSAPGSGSYTYDIFDYDRNEWQSAYYDLLLDARTEKLAGNVEDGNTYIDSYFLYDSNQNGTPELYVTYGDCEANYDVQVYEYNDGNVDKWGSIAGGHTSFYSVPDEGIMVYWGHMACENVELAKYENGAFEFEELSSREFTDDPDAGYTKASDLIPGAQNITLMRYDLDLPLMTYDQPFYSTATSLTYDEVEAKLTETYEENGQVYAATADGFGGDMGIMSFDDFLQPGMMSEFMDNPAQVAETQWIDMNQDGQMECVLKMSIEGSYEPIYVVLSLQNDVVYAYSIHYLDEKSMFYEDGTFDFAEEYKERMIFDKSQCYLLVEE